MKFSYLLLAILLFCNALTAAADVLPMDPNEPYRPYRREIEPLPPDPLDDPASILAKRSIYFGKGSTVVRDEFKALIEAHSQYLLSHKSRRIVIAGNTDARGNREYNLNIGQARAEAVRALFLQHGVPAEQIETLTYGEERLKSEGENEAAHAENRRVDIDYDH